VSAAAAYARRHLSFDRAAERCAVYWIVMIAASAAAAAADDDDDNDDVNETDLPASSDEEIWYRVDQADYGTIRAVPLIAVLKRFMLFVLDIALPEWVSEYAVRQAYTTPDSAVSHLNHAPIA